MKNFKKYLCPVLLALLLCALCCAPAFASSGVAGVVESTWKDAGFSRPGHDPGHCLFCQAGHGVL